LTAGNACPNSGLSQIAPREEKTGIPDDAAFKTKNEIAPGLIRSIQDGGLFPFRYVLGDGAFGHDAKFLGGLPKGVSYFAAARPDDKFFASPPEARARPVRKRQTPEE
jgi:SRSO17 transposase